MKKILNTTFSKRYIDGKEVYEAIFTAPTIDRDNELILTSGIDVSSYQKNPVIFYDHAWSTWDSPSEGTLPIGKAVKVEISKTQGKAQFVFSDLPFAQNIKTLVDEGILNMTSIGFVPKEYIQGPNEMQKILAADGIKIDDLPRVMYTKSEMLEFSIVGIPSNREAAILNNFSGAKAEKIKSILNAVNFSADDKTENSETIGSNPKNRERTLTLLEKRINSYTRKGKPC